MVGNTSVVVTDIVPVNSKITDCKLNDSNYLEWIHVIKLYLTSLDKSDHLSKPLADQDATWVRDDARLFLQICNSIDEGIVGFISHCASIKELMEYLEYLYAGKGNITRVYDVCLLSEFDTARFVILSSSAIPSLANVFPRLSRSVQSQPSMLEAAIPSNNDLVGRHPRSGNGKNSQGYTFGGIVCHYCHKPGHIKRDCRRWLRERGNLTANTASTTEASSKLITVSADEFAKFSEYQESLKRSSSSVTVIADSDGSTSHALGSGTITPIPSLPLSSDLLTKRVIGKGREFGGLYVLDTTRREPVACSGVVTPVEAHCRLGHPSLPLLKKLCLQFSSLSSLHCESCQLSKHYRVPLSPRVYKRASAPFELVHSDIWGPCSVTSKLGFKYFITFVDDFSRITWLYLLKSCSELFEVFCGFCVEIKTQFGVPVKILRSDNAKEYFSLPFVSYMRQKGMLHQSSCVDTPSQNGVAERKNRHLLETARALMFQMGVPKQF
ncbi:PREDICTED: uncharacterized protein LOC109150012 [Ipomoea nil]|uniref:uncharacterized protein LOC109150012 n=1 Tax=Ipomoea nil TaxID=35883 RepID=UPI0009011AC9|nr:PREDICTED: uncharacterized protein LOC109150012 [Ipomoea nil]